MPTVFEIGDVIAERRLTFQPGEGAPQDVTVRIGRPALDASAPHETWICPFQIEGIGSGKTRGIFDADAMQALLLAINNPLLNSPCASETQGVSFCILASRIQASSPHVEWRSNTPETNFHLVKVDEFQLTFPLRGYVRCETCGKPLTASWSKGRSDYYAYYHCRGRCRAVNISKAKLEELFVEELARLQPTAGFMRLVKDRVLHAWRETEDGRGPADRRDRAQAESHSREAGPFGSGVPVRADDRHRHVRPPPRQAARGAHARADGPTLLRSSRKSTWKASWRSQNAFYRARRTSGSSRRSTQKQRLQQVFFPDGIRFDGKRLVGTGVTLPVFNYLSPVSGSEKDLVDLTGIEPVTS